VMSEMGLAMMGIGRARGEFRAREAAEAAIRSPLLEDVNLNGARGILVNISAGPELTLGEFSEVGDVIEAFASDNATVVVGTVIDDDMGDDLKVTVVATGLGGLTDLSVKTHESALGTHLRADGSIDYKGMDKPAILRQKGRLGYSSVGSSGSRGLGSVAVKSSMVPPSAQKPAEEVDYLDIPAFLRRQAE